MARDTQTVEYGTSTIEYTLIYTSRKTLGISVHPDLSVIVTAPEGSDIELVRQKIRKRAASIPADSAAIDALSAECDLVITGSGD